MQKNFSRIQCVGLPLLHIRTLDGRWGRLGLPHASLTHNRHAGQVV